jgi:thiamine biosynthesis lipoprotein
MGTICRINVLHTDEAVAERAATAAFAEMERLEALMTTWRPTSDVSRVNAAAGREGVVVAPETLAVIEKALWIARKSGGAFDITVGAFAGLWKFDQDNDQTIPPPQEVAARKRLLGWRDVQVDAKSRTVKLRRAGQRITLGGIAKGYVVDAAVAVMRGQGLENFMVQAGGDLFLAGRRGTRDWIVGIQDPRASSQDVQSGSASFAFLSLSNQAFTTSGDYERFVIKGNRRYHHILDPKTGFPVTHTRSVTILAPTTFLADTVDTAVFILGAERGLALIEHLPGVEGVVVDAHNHVHVSKGLAGRLKQVRPPTDGL